MHNLPSNGLITDYQTWIGCFIALALVLALSYIGNPPNRNIWQTW